MKPVHGATHFVVPDTQVKPGVAIDHLSWVGRYIAEKAAGRQDVKVIHLGDHWDMPSLSSYDKGKKAMEGRRFVDDIEAGNHGMDVLSDPLSGRRTKHVRLELLRGNHEGRVTRAAENDAQLDGLLSLDLLKSPGWQVHDFLDIVNIDGVAYSHYFYAPMSGRPYGGMIETRIKNVGSSFTMGHQQTLMYGLLPSLSGMRHGLVAGACYLHDEDYRGPQGQRHYRGIVVCHEVVAGDYCPMFVSLDFLCRRYEGKPLSEFKPKMFA